MPHLLPPGASFPDTLRALAQLVDDANLPAPIAITFYETRADAVTSVDIVTSASAHDRWLGEFGDEHAAHPAGHLVMHESWGELPCGPSVRLTSHSETARAAS